MSVKQTEEKITALYERLSRDDDKSKVHKLELLFSRPQKSLCNRRNLTV